MEGTCKGCNAEGVELNDASLCATCAEKPAEGGEAPAAEAAPAEGGDAPAAEAAPAEGGDTPAAE